MPQSGGVGEGDQDVGGETALLRNIEILLFSAALVGGLFSAALVGGWVALRVFIYKWLNPIFDRASR